MDRRRQLRGRDRTSTGARRTVLAGLVALATLGLVACAETYDHGYIISDEAISQIQTGSSREQVLLALGTPSTTATIGGEAFYYVSQHAERMAAFLDQRVTDQKVLAVYFDDKGQVKEVANYGLKDGKVFDFIGRKTKTGGGDYGFLTQIMNAGPANPFVSNQ